MNRALVLAAIAALVGCKREQAKGKPKTSSSEASKPPRAACTPEYAGRLCTDGDPMACGWVHALDDTALDDAELRSVLPALEQKRLLDGDPPRPSAPTYSFESSPPYTLEFPIDWTADPYHDRSWRSGLQNLTWLPGSYDSRARILDQSAYVIVDWADAALAPGASLEWTWNDAALAKRLHRVSRFLDRYLEDRVDVNRRVLIAAIRIISSHLHAMSLRPCYSASNHGMMQDLALVRDARVLPGLPTAEAIHARAVERLVAHVEASVTDDGIHVENSPEYHLMYILQVIEAIDMFVSMGEPPPGELISARDRLQASLVYLLQPNQTLPQFGDSTNNGPQRIRESVAAARRQGSTSPALEQLEWILSDGAAGLAPSELEHVFTLGGYAMFREQWAGPEDIVAHFRSGRLSKVHDHADDTSFEIYGRGSELVVDTGKYSYEYADPLVVHQYDARAHNVLIVDDATFDDDRTSRIVDSGDGWVRGEHTGYASRGVSVSRTFGYARPDTFVVVDRARATASHEYAQHFHLHPNLPDVQVIDDHTVRAAGADGAELTLTAGERPVRIDVVRSENDAGGVQGWYFYGWKNAIPAVDVIFVYGARSDSEITLPVVLTVGTTAAMDIRLDGDTVTWSRGGKSFGAPW